MFWFVIRIAVLLLLSPGCGLLLTLVLAAAMDGTRGPGEARPEETDGCTGRISLPVWFVATVVAFFLLYALPPRLLWAIFALACLSFLGLSCWAYTLIHRRRPTDPLFLC